MAHYAKVVDGLVTQVIVAEAEHIATLEGSWVKTSYNVHGGVYYDPATNAPAEDQSVIAGDEARERKNYAGIGANYDGTGFYGDQPFPSWTLNSTSYLWEAPSAMPDDDKLYRWDEDSKAWVEFTNGPKTLMPDDGKDYTWNEDTEEWVEIS